jgi:hypothetical protein
MNKFNFIFKKSFWKNVLAVVVVAILCAGIIGGGIALGKYIKSAKKSPVLNWGRGALDNTGKYYETNNSIYTKDMFECRGLEIMPDFGSQVTYKVVFYNDEGEFLSIVDMGTKKFNSVQVPLFAKYARVEINAGVVDGDKVEIGLLDILKYSKQVSIKVDKKQSTLNSRLSKIEADNVVTMRGQGFMDPQFNFTSDSSAPIYFANSIDVSTMSNVVVKVKTTTLSHQTVLNGNAIPGFVFYKVKNGSIVEYYGSTSYNVVYTDGEFSYISMSVVNADTLYIGCDVDSSEVMECYLFA